MNVEIFRDLFFFFSSRRRHTRFDCDWSSDVCSSDLDGVVEADAEAIASEQVVGHHPGSNRLHPEAVDRRAVRTHVAQVGNVHGFTIDESHIHGGVLLSGTTMVAKGGCRGLTALALALAVLAQDLTALAISPLSGRSSEARAKGTRKTLGRTEAHAERNLHHRGIGLRAQAYRRQFEPPPADVIAERFAHEGVEQAVEMKRRE